MKFTTSRSYGDARRIWMLRETWTSHFIIGKRLGDLSLWGGHDKQSEGIGRTFETQLVSWEFNPDRFEEAVSYLAGCGFEWVSTTEVL